MELKGYCFLNLEPPYSGMRDIYNRQNTVYFAKKIIVDYCFLGDSITEGFPVEYYFGDKFRVINRGIGGEIISQANERFFADVVQVNSKSCVFMEGINDISQLWQKLQKGEKVYFEKELLKMQNSYQQIINQAKEYSIKMIICSVLPIGINDIRNEWVLRVNMVLRDLCKKEKIDFVDYHSHLTTSNGTLKDVTLGDLVHPVVDGYDIMANVLLPYLK